MKTKNLLWAALSMTAALVMTACSSDDNNMTETPQAPSTSKTIPYTVTVGGDEATTRATVDGDNKTLRFATGDKLYITGTGIQGVLDLQDGGAGETNNVTFSGELTYDGTGSPADDLSLTATLVSEQQLASLSTANPLVTVNAAGAVTVNYPTTAYCTSINDAVQKYSNLTGTSTYGARAFTLTQQTAFLNFVITFEDGTATGTELTAVVNNNSSNTCSASVTTETVSGNVVAKFVLPVAAGTALSSATVTMGSKAALAISDATLTGKVYNVTRTQAAAALALNLTSPAVGQVIGDDGKNYNYASLPGGVTAVAKICYVSGSNGLALALADEGQMNWGTAISTCAAHTPAFTNGTWKLATQDEWTNMITAAGGYTALRDGFSSVGGSNLLSNYYWSSTVYDSDRARIHGFFYGDWGYDDKVKDYVSVRACLAWTQAAVAPAPKAAAEATAEDKGKLIGTDGKIYADVAAATAAGTTAVAKIIYIGTTGHATYNHGLALALTDEGQMAWEAAKTACNTTKNTSTPVTGATWLLASNDQWNYMMGANGAGSYTALRDGSNLQSASYWSSTGTSDPNYAWVFPFGGGDWYTNWTGYGGFYVRACLAF